MKNIILIAFNLLLVFSASAQTEKIFVKSFAQVNEYASLNLEGEVKVKEWEEPFVRIHTTVTLENGSTEVLKTLLVEGRYRLELSQNGDWLISSNARKEEVLYKGQILKEMVSYTVFVPKYMVVQFDGEGGDDCVSR